MIFDLRLPIVDATVDYRRAVAQGEAYKVQFLMHLGMMSDEGLAYGTQLLDVKTAELCTLELERRAAL